VRKQKKTNKFTKTMEENVAYGQLKEIVWLWITETWHVPRHANTIQHKQTLESFLCWKLLSEVQVTLLFAQVIEDAVLDKNSIHFKLQKGLFH
jgi:hypothetical protein